MGHVEEGEKVSVMNAEMGQRNGLPFLATTFHPIGVSAMDTRERKRDVLEGSRRVVRDMIVWFGTVVVEGKLQG